VKATKMTRELYTSRTVIT